jgi:hypothetical protein
LAKRALARFPVVDTVFGDGHDRERADSNNFNAFEAAAVYDDRFKKNKIDIRLFGRDI